MQTIDGMVDDIGGSTMSTRRAVRDQLSPFSQFLRVGRTSHHGVRRLGSRRDVRFLTGEDKVEASKPTIRSETGGIGTGRMQKRRL